MRALFISTTVCFTGIMTSKHLIDVSRVPDLFAEIESKAAVLPAHIQRDGKDVAIVLSPQQYNALIAMGRGEPNPTVLALHKRSMERRRSLYEALARYEREHPEDN